MIRKITGFSLLATALLGFFPLACQPGGVGDPCTPEDEYGRTFSGYNAKEVNVESKSFQCETRVCLVNHFQGRVSCKYGQAAPTITTEADGTKTSADARCFVPGSPGIPAKAILTKVDAQLRARTADKAVYCSCRCDGEDQNARYCKCPSGYACTHLVDDLHLGGGQLAGSYCVRDGTGYTGTESETCAPTGYITDSTSNPPLGQDEPNCGPTDEG